MNSQNLAQPNLAQPNPLLEKLHDIEGLDYISSWPPAVGWWILLAVGALLLAVLLFYVIKKVLYYFSWKRDSDLKLSRLEKNLTENTARETAASLSEYLRRIVMQRFPRQECAGLAGEEWLIWLSKHDENKFDWCQKGKFLIAAPYAPKDKPLPLQEVKDLIHAVRNWVR